MANSKKWKALDNLYKILKFSDDAEQIDIDAIEEEIVNEENVETPAEQGAEQPKEQDQFSDDEKEEEIEVVVEEDKDKELFSSDEELVSYIKELEAKIAELESKLIETVEVVQENFRKIVRTPSTVSNKFSSAKTKNLNNMSAYEKYLYNKNKK